VQYVGLDESEAMLEVFERRRPRSPHVRLVRADADAAWPVPDASVRAVFASRAVHLFRSAEHLVGETLRVARGPGATFTTGRVERDDDGTRSALRREMRARLRARGYAPGDGERGTRGALDAFRARGSAPLAPVTAARWPVTVSARRVLDDWREKSGLGGCEPAESDKSAVLAELAGWAADRFGSLDAPVASEERYILEGVVLPARRASAETDGTT
jgi:Methyltransferase domain